MNHRQKIRLYQLERVQDNRRLTNKEQKEYDKLYDLFEDEQEQQF